MLLDGIEVRQFPGIAQRREQHVLRTFLIEHAPNRTVFDGANHICYLRIGIERRSVSIARVQCAFHRFAIAEQERIVVEKSHVHPARHGIKIGIAILDRLHLVSLSFLEKYFARERTLRNPNHLHAFLTFAVRSKSKLVDVLLGIDSHAFERSFKFLQAGRKHLVFQSHGGAGVLQRPVIHRDYLLHIRWNHAARGAAHSRRPRSRCRKQQHPQNSL